ncbi:PspA/IM30 family-domain-containing protein [Baffinella frigidus]|nr:PspA/IM30 family-domain-containing protein [Cryptophyta sp. CCMP2293]
MFSRHLCAAVALACALQAAAFHAGVPALSPVLARSGANAAVSPMRLRSPAAAQRRVTVVGGLQMGMFDRFSRLVKANVNEMLNKAEDPEKMLNQIVEDMQKELVEFRQTYAEVAANTKRLDKQRVQALGLTEEWMKRAKLALEKGDEEAARAALERKNQQEEQATSLAKQLEGQTQAVQNLFSQMQQLEQKISQAKVQKDQLKARAQTAKVSTKINDMMSKTSSTGALDAFNRMSDKVEQMEAEAEVAAELSGTDTSLDRRFAVLESSSKVMKDAMGKKEKDPERF